MAPGNLVEIDVRRLQIGSGLDRGAERQPGAAAHHGAAAILILRRDLDVVECDVVECGVDFGGQHQWPELPFGIGFPFGLGRRLDPHRAFQMVAKIGCRQNCRQIPNCRALATRRPKRNGSPAFQLRGVEPDVDGLVLVNAPRPASAMDRAHRAPTASR